MRDNFTKKIKIHQAATSQWFLTSINDLIPVFLMVIRNYIGPIGEHVVWQICSKLRSTTSMTITQSFVILFT